jgi:hypothetical protein
MGCKTVWASCMTFIGQVEERFYHAQGFLPDVLLFQSQFQRDEILHALCAFPSVLEEMGRRTVWKVVPGAFDVSEFPYRPKAKRDTFVIGKVARCDTDKWPENLWAICSAVRAENRRAVMMGVSERTLGKIGPAPDWAACLPPASVPVQTLLASLDVMLSVNGGARENWPRVGLEAMSSGVPVVAPRAWGWMEMIRDGETGLLGRTEAEYADACTLLASDHKKRDSIAQAAREWVEATYEPQAMWKRWQAIL